VRVCVWGAGTIGRGIARRLVSESFVSTLHWINRGETVRGCVFDLKHGLAFAPSRHEVLGYLEPQASRAINRSDLVILTHGAGVTDGDRASLYPQNRQIMRDAAIPALRGFQAFCSWSPIP
jgi:malate/lactate dehydrogenase